MTPVEYMDYFIRILALMTLKIILKKRTFIFYWLTLIKTLHAFD